MAVDIPELKSQVLAELGRASLQAHVLARFEQAAHVAALAPSMVRPFMGLAERVTGLVDLPAPRTRRQRHRRFDAKNPGDVVVLPDVFTGAIEARTLDTSVEVLTALGVDVSVAPFVASGKFDHVKGNRRRFARATARRAELVKSVVDAGAVPVVIEPAIALLHRHEYRAIGDASAHRHVRTLADVLLDHRDRRAATGNGRRVRVLGHCTERANAPEQLDAWVAVLSAAGWTVDAPAVGCCGMAGIFGHERSNQSMSRTLWERSWQEPAAGLGTDVVAATGYSCRSQSARFGADVVHPVELLR